MTEIDLTALKFLSDQLEEVGKAGFLPADIDIAKGQVKLYCTGSREIKQNIFWYKDGVKVQGSFIENPASTVVQNIYTVTLCIDLLVLCM